jgi:hypothetical protein
VEVFADLARRPIFSARRPFDYAQCGLQAHSPSAPPGKKIPFAALRPDGFWGIFRGRLICMKQQVYLSILGAMAATLLAGCASNPAYHDVKASLTPQPGKGLVIFYFQRHMLRNDAKCQINVNGERLPGSLKPGTFYTYQADPGKLQITTTQSFGPSRAGEVPKDQPSLDVLAGQTYYVDLRLGLLGGNEKLRLVSQDKAEREVKDCRWVGAAR